MALFALVFGSALVVLVAVLVRGLGSPRRNGWAARTDGDGGSSWTHVSMGSDHGGADNSGSDCSSSDAGGGGGCDGGGGGGGGGGD